MKVREAHPGPGERIDIGGADLAPEAPDVAEPPIVGEQDDDVGPFPLGRASARGERGHTEQRDRPLHRGSSLFSTISCPPAGRLSIMPSSPTVIGPSKYSRASPRKAG